ncbi:MAG: histidinol-phosphatase [Caldithrix sp.]|nr:histidinol-phosphatase [Caldithrix sp.]
MSMDHYKLFFKQLADVSAEIIRPYFQNPQLQVESKTDQSPVTAADRGAEAAMRKLINQKYPDHGIIGEEYGNEGDDAEWVWTLDPIDGTLSFIHGVPLYGTIVSLLHNGQPVMGMIHQPEQGLLCIGDNHQTEVNDRPVRMRAIESVYQATLLATDIDHIRAHQNFKAFYELVKSVHLFRTWGDCYGYMMLAAGRADIMIDPVMHTWDLLPLIPIITGAGGHISGWQGEDAATAKSCVAAHRHWHTYIIEQLNKAV